MKHCLTILKKALFVSLFLLVSFAVYAQNVGVYKNGVRQGAVNVKFTPSMAEQLQSTKISTKSNRLSTGIANFDKVAGNVKATNLRRIFPDTPQNAHKLRKHGLHLWYTMEIDEGVDPKSAAQTLSKFAEVGVVEIDREKGLPPYTITKYKMPKTESTGTQPFNDPFLKDQWHYNNTGQHNIPNVYDANVFNAWKLTAGKSNVIVSVHDTGIDVNHEDLKGNMWVNPRETSGNGIDDDLNGYADDINGWNFTYNMGTMVPADHGTHVAGTIAAVNNNGVGVAGVAGGTGKGDGVKIMAMQIIGATAEATAQSYIYAADNGAVISQNSWNYKVEGIFEQVILDAIQYFIAEAGDYEGSPMKGGIVIFSSGNDASQGNWYPGNRDYIFTVNALGPDGKLTGYSNYGTWTNISAPGGNSKAVNNGFGTPAGVLSTLVANEYGYMDGTSMACPHVSGIAALVLANSPSKITNTMLWKRLESAGRNIDQLNPDYIGKLGVGAIDAFLAVQNDEKIAPNKINDLSIKEFNESSATLEWTIPEDGDNVKPESYTIYYSKSPITAGNYKDAFDIKIDNAGEAGQKMTYTVDGLVGNTLYYFAVTSTDLWENVSDLSNIISGKSEKFPTIEVSTGNAANNIVLSTDINSATSVSTAFDILNKSTGDLVWSYFTRNTGSVMATSSVADSYNPIVDIQSAKYQYTTLGGSNNQYGVVRATRENTSNADFTPFNPTVKSYVVYLAGKYIGDNDVSIPTSSAVKYVVDEENGFNLTGSEFNLSYTAGSGSIRIEVYKDNLEKKNLLHTEYFSYHEDIYRQLVSVEFKEHFYFEKGKEFFIAVHVPKGNLYPLLMDKEIKEEYSTYCYYSSSLGAEWILLEQAVLNFVGAEAKTYAWNTGAVTKMADTGKHLILDPASGTISGNSKSTINLTANAASLINGKYDTNLVIKSNSPNNDEVRIPVTFTVSGHKPKIVYPIEANFGQLFKGNDTIVDIVVENHGYGLMKGLSANITGSSDFTLYETPKDTIQARNTLTYRVKFNPTTEGNASATLNVTNGVNTYSVSLYGTGKGLSKIVIDPAEQTKSGLTLGDLVSAEVKIKNEGTYPLKYFIPGFDDRGISENWPSKYHIYGYVIRSNHADITEDTSLAYDFTDISSTGVDITADFKESDKYSTVPIGFKFPYYDGEQDTIYITKAGFTTFDNSLRPVNVPTLNSTISPRGYISMLGYSINGPKYDVRGRVLYKNEPDRLIIQYENVPYGEINFTAQMVFFANGNIRFYYKDMPSIDAWGRNDVNILIENTSRADGILLRNNSSDFYISSNTAIGFDYPGKPIITSIENASGSVSPGEFATVKVNMSTESLAEGVTDRYINVISSDPAKERTHSLIKLDIVTGGTANHTVSTDTIDFGNIYRNVDYKEVVKVVNTGTKNININQLVFDAAKYTVTGGGVVKPGQYCDITIVPNTSAVTTLEDELTIKFEGGAEEKVTLLATVSLSPILDADNSLVERTMSLTDRESIPYEIKNTGFDDLSFSVVGSNTLAFEETSGNTISDYDYVYRTHNNGEITYSWIDITQTGTKIENSNGLSNFWTDVNLPFSFKFYDAEHSSLKISNWGIVAFGGNPNNLIANQARLPQANTNSAYISPGVSALVYNNAHYEGLAGVYYQEVDDSFVISWEYYTNMNSMGTNSMQVVMYKDGSFKYQYKMRTNNDGVSNRQVVGIQRQGENTAIIAKNAGSYFNHGKGMSYLFQPNNTYTLQPGGSITGNIHIDPSKAYGGVINDTLKIMSNDPSNLLFEKPFKLVIDGAPEVELSETEVDFGSKDVVIEYGSYKSYDLPLYIINTGTAPLTITNAAMEKGDKSLVQEIFLISGHMSSSWDSISNVFKGGNKLTVLPGYGNRLYTRAKYTPTKDGEYEDVLIIYTDAGEKRITLKGKSAKAESSVLNVDKTPIDFVLNKYSDKEVKAIDFDNIQGVLDLEYTTSIEYRRSSSEIHLNSIREDEKMGSGLVPSSVSNALSASKTTKSEPAYNRELMYNDGLDINLAVGSGGSERYVTATHYKAGPEGFNITDVATFFRAQTLKEGVIDVEVRAGGYNILDAATVGKGSLNFVNESQDDNGGSLKVITLDNETLILPNENFYVIFRYPMLISTPQLGVNNPSVETVPFRYMFRFNNAWYDLQTGYEDFEHTAFAHMVLEKDAKGSGWVKILNNVNGTVKVGESSSLDIEVSGEFAAQGEQKAVLIFNSNDLVNPTIEVPLILNINKGPQFINASTSISVAETESRTVTVNVEDPENDAISSITTLENIDFVTYTESNGVLKYTIAPQYGDAGSYVVTFRATDEHGMTNDLKVNVEVVKSNRAPVYSGDVTKFVYSVQNDEITYNIGDFFSDPDGDEFRFSVEAADESVVSVYYSSGNFRVKPKAVGNTTLDFTVTDAGGAETTHSIDVEIEDCISAEVIVQKWNTVLLVNNANGTYKPDGYQWYKNGQPIQGATKQYYAAGGNGSEQLDFTATYFVKMVTTDGKIVYSCNYTPQELKVSLSAYPNPVKRGQQLTLEASLPDLSENPIEIQVINMSGQMVKRQVSKETITSIDMPSATGSYIVRVRQGQLNKTFNIIVE